MNSREILFVARLSDTLEKGLSYALYLASTLGKDLRILLVREKSLSERFDDIMTAVTFAEANEHGTARQYLAPPEGESQAIVNIIRRCSEGGVKATVHAGIDNPFSSIKAFLSNRSRFDMVLLGPSISRSNGTVKKLVKSSPLPVVAMVN